MSEQETYLARAADADDDECPLCGGRGEVEASTLREERDVIGCPWCIEHDWKERLAAISRRLQEPDMVDIAHEVIVNGIYADTTWYTDARRPRRRGEEAGGNNMSRSGYSDDDDDPRAAAMWRGQVASTIRGKRGQAFLRELVDALDAMPAKRLIAKELRLDGQVCALGSVGARRGIDLETLDPEDYDTLASVFGVAHQLIQEIEYINDEASYWGWATPERRWQYVRNWAQRNLKLGE